LGGNCPQYLEKVPPEKGGWGTRGGIERRSRDPTR